jgi:hypothetical protein
MEAEADPTLAMSAKPPRVTVREAVEMFLNDEEARGLEEVSRRKSKTCSSANFSPGARRAS